MLSSANKKASLLVKGIVLNEKDLKILKYHLLHYSYIKTDFYIYTSALNNMNLHNYRVTHIRPRYLS